MNESTLQARRRLLGHNLSIAYDNPLKIVKGVMQYLYDEDGRQYLDAYNNVAHVGHCHPKVVEAGLQQMASAHSMKRLFGNMQKGFLREVKRRLRHGATSTVSDEK